jgi:hypothetical protein
MVSGGDDASDHRPLRMAGGLRNPNRGRMRARSPVRSPLRPPTPRGVADHSHRRSRRRPPGLASGQARRRPFTSSSPQPSSRPPRREPGERPDGAGVGFSLDDPYVQQVWAGVIGSSGLLVLRRLPVLWRARPALVDLRELGQSLGLDRSLARSGRTWRTIERLVAFGMAHWLPGDELAVRAQVAPPSGRQLARLPGRTRQVHDRLLGTHLDRLALAHTDRTLDPDRSLDTARVTARLDHLQHRHPAITRGLGLQP